MKKLQKPLTVLAMTFVFGISTLAADAASAKQRSLDSRIFETYEKINERSTAHEDNAAIIRKNLDETSKQIAKLQEEYKKIEGDAVKERMNMRAELAVHTAQYLNHAHKLVDSALGFISNNLSDLADLAEVVRKTGDPRGSIAELETKINENVVAGKSMMNALVELRTWAHQDPRMAGRFRSLHRLTRTLDARVGIDKARLLGRSKGSPLRGRQEQLTSLDRTVDRLGDMYTQVQQEKGVLIALKEDLTISIQMGRFEMINEVGERAIPNLIETKSPSVGISTLEGLADKIGEMNSDFYREGTVTRTPGRPGEPNETIELPPLEFKNLKI